MNRDITYVIKQVYNNLLLRDPNQSEYDRYNNMLENYEKHKKIFKIDSYESMIERIKNKIMDTLIYKEYNNLYGFKKINEFINKPINLDTSCNCNIKRTQAHWNTLWRILHIITYVYPDNPTLLSRKNIIVFFYNLRYKIQCPKCRLHYGKYIDINSINNVPNDKISYINWLIDLHNNINIRLRKKTVTYKEANKIYNISNPISILFIRTYNIDGKILFG